ncbi:MAG: hypothetical protein K6T75_03635 [Acetobacteraceae bacterium]|nr:hypothetical protein [Acetobacteraceae bacterium]
MRPFPPAWRRAVAVFCALAAVALAAAGCARPPAAPGAPAEKPASAGGFLRMPIVADPTFNPHHPKAYVESVFCNRALYNCLTRPGLDLVPSADLAESWETSPDGLTWTFKLRQGVKWHDGQPFSADDVKFTFDLILNPDSGSGTAKNFTVVKSVEAVDPYTVRFTLSQPFASLPAFLGYNCGILPKHLWEGKDLLTNDEFNKKHPVGTGPFKFQEFVSGDHVTLVANPDYFRGKPKLDGIIFKILPDANAQTAQLLSGDLDLILVEQPQNARVLKDNPSVVVDSVDQVNFVYFAANLTRPLFGDKRVRQAMSHAIDKQAVIDNILAGYGKISTGPISPAMKAYYNPNVRQYPYEPARAKALLAEAGWTPGADGILAQGGKKFSFVLTAPRVQAFEQICTLGQQYWKAVGMDVTLEAMEFNQCTSQRVIPRNYDVLSAWWITPSDPDVFPYFHSSGATKGMNLPLYQNPEADRLLEQGRATADPAARRQVYDRFQALVAEELPYVFLYHPLEIRAWSAKLQGIPGLGLRDAMQYSDEWYFKP